MEITSSLSIIFNIRHVTERFVFSVNKFCARYVNFKFKFMKTISNMKSNNVYILCLILLTVEYTAGKTCVTDK